MTEAARDPDGRPPPPVDDPFLERLFGVMCQHVPIRPDDHFVDLVRRWYETLQFMAALRPRTGSECLLAADVSMKNQFVLAALARGRTPSARRRRMQSKAFIEATRELNDAQLQYEVVRSRPLCG